MSGALYIGMDDLVDALGGTVAVRLVAALGGTRVYVGRRVRGGNRIVAAIGAEAAGELAAYIETGHGGMWIEIPRGPTGETAELRRRVSEAAASYDLSEAEIARRYRVHGRTVRRARARLREAEHHPQRRLF